MTKCTLSVNSYKYLRLYTRTVNHSRAVESQMFDIGAVYIQSQVGIIICLQVMNVQQAGYRVSIFYKTT